MTGIAVLDQKHPAPVPVALSKVLQGLNVMVRILAYQAGCFHPTTMHDQKQQHVDRAMAHVLELLLFDRAGDSTAEGLSLQRLTAINLRSPFIPLARLRERGWG